MKRAVAASVLAMGLAVAVAAQPPANPRLDAQLRQLFPAAGAFSPKTGNPPRFDVLAPGSSHTIIGLAFWTTDLAPLERGYDGPIKVLVGLDMRGTIAGIVVADHHEPYGYFSVDTPEFAAQFKGKSVRDAFRVGGDVDAISRATLTVSSATRAIRDSSRRIAAAYTPAAK